MTYIVIVSVLVFLVVSLTLTQLVYSDLKYIAAGLIISVFLPICLILLSVIKPKITYLNACFFTAYYFLFLLVVKINYRRINEYLKSKGFVTDDYLEKDFTFVNWDGDLPGSGFWWNTKLSSNPSKLDTVLTVLILIIPIILFSLINWLLT